MSGICSAHKHYEPGCPQCDATKHIYIDPPYDWQTAKQERLGSCPQVPSEHPPGPASDYCEKCQEEAFIQRLGRERYDWLAKLAEKETQDENSRDA